MADKWVEEELKSMRNVIHQMRASTPRQTNISATVKELDKLLYVLQSMR